MLARKIEERVNYRILGFFENGFRHISNRKRPIRTPADFAGLRIRVLPSKIQARTFELLGAVPLRLDLTEAIAAIEAARSTRRRTRCRTPSPTACTSFIASTRFRTISTSRGRSSCIAPRSMPGPTTFKPPCSTPCTEAIAFQRDLHVHEEEDAHRAIEAAGGEIVALTPDQHDAFVAAVSPIYGEARQQYGEDLLALVGTNLSSS